SPNVMLVIDVSGSMSWCAYNPDSSKSGCCSSPSGCGWTYQGNEEGYFDPSKVYRYNSSGYWEETTGTPATCPKSAYQCSWRGCYDNLDKTKLYSGSCLNFLYMTRIDLVRWALTGGTPNSCSTGVNQQPQNNAKTCDPETYGQPGSKVSCDSYGCLLKSNSGVKVKVPWSRINSALLLQFKKLSLKPRFGIMFYSDYGIRNNASVYIGDFAGSNVYDPQNPYKNVITAVNEEDPSGGTPTAPALWDTYNYFAQIPPQYGGLQPQTGQNDAWKNPIYQCFDANNDGYCSSNELKPVPCAKNFVILMTDGQWNIGGPPNRVGVACSIDTGFEQNSADPVVPAYWMHKKGFTNALTGINSRVEAFYGIGLFLGGTGAQSLKNVAMYGSFDTTGRNWPDSLSGYPQGTCWVDDCSNYINSNGKGSGCTKLPPSSPDWDKNGDGNPDTFFAASNAIEMKDALYSAILDILKRASAGSTVATLSTKTSISSVLVQPFFYPTYTDSQGNTLTWPGFLRSFWVDPKNDLREDTNQNKELNLNVDKIFQTFYDSSTNETKAALLSDTSTCSMGSVVSMKDLKSVFDSGCWLGNCDPNNRNIYYSTGADLNEFKTSNVNDMQNIWDLVDDNTSNNSINSTIASCIIRYIRGEDVSNDSSCNFDYVKRNLKINISDLCPGSTGLKTWKLGDIIHSTPAVIGNEPINSYHLRYSDSTYYEYIKSEPYKNRASRIIVGANDGMLHFFRLGYIKDQSSTDPDNPSVLQNSPNNIGTDLIAKEEFAFIPKNAIPYLLWYGHKDYCHIPTVDSRVLIFDASINGNPTDDKTSNSWRTILVGVMGFGGKSLSAGTTKYSSSIFALDLTDWLNGTTTTPTLLWEKTLPDNTLTISFPSVVRRGDANKNGSWYVVIGSGPKVPNPSSNNDYISSPSLYFFDLKTGNLVKTIQISLPTNTVAAVADTLPIDANDDYNDDAIYFGLFGLQNQGTIWYNWGNFYRLILDDSLSNTPSVAVDLSSFANNGQIPPVTAAPTFSKDEKGNLWVFFGTGRFLSEGDKILNYNNYFIGFKDPCWDGSCSTTFVKGDFVNQTNITVTATVAKTQQICLCDSSGCSNKTVVTETTNYTQPVEVDKGWYQELINEAVISQPIVFGGIIDFLSYVPPNDVCSFEGNSKLYTLYYKSGTAYPVPSILSPKATSGTSGQVTIYKSIDLGRGAPPIGNPFQVNVSQGSTNRYEKFIQISTGVVIKQTQQPTPSAQPRFILWIEK
ncbi:PilC/PilY family type IV pilus protein, partial [Sulfurihydrogenibium sp.]|uniref:pilus assembly protein n=1 Tax=Sulfurihydrogenibium sp. TaxID=2053621 RepID=UPI00262841F6